MTEADTAEELGTVREDLEWSLGTLRRAGVIALAGGGRFLVTDFAALRNHAAV